MPRVGALYRLSSTKQVKAQRREEGDTIPGQQAAVRRFLEARPGWDLVPAHEYEEPGVSAFKKRIHERPVLLRVLDAAKAGEFDVFCVFREDRLSRGDEDSGAELLYILSELERAQVQVWSVADQKHLTVKGTQLVIRAVEADTANQESKKTGMRVKNANRTGAEAGRWHGGRVPLGYRLEPKLDANGQLAVRGGRLVNELKVHPEHAAIVENVFRFYIGGQGTPTIAARMNATGAPSFSGKGWDSNGVMHILSNRFYLGEIGWHQSGRVKDGDTPFSVPGLHPPIIARDLFDQAQRMREARSRIPKRQLSPNYALGGLAYCACGARIGGITRESGQRQYRCRGWVMQGHCPAGTKHLPADEIEQNFVTALEEQFTAPTALRTFLEQRAAADQAAATADQATRKRAQKRIQEIDGALKQLDRAYLEAGTVTDDEYREKKAAYQEERRQVEEEVARPAARGEVKDVGMLAEAVKQLRQNWPYLTPEERKAAALSLVQGWKLKVLVYPDKRVVITAE